MLALFTAHRRFTLHWTALAGAALRGVVEFVALWRARSGRPRAPRSR